MSVRGGNWTSWKGGARARALLLGSPSSSTSNPGVPGKVSCVLPGHSAQRSKEPYLLEAPRRTPLGGRQGCLGLGSMYVCVVVCVHENWHICTNVAVSGPGAESKSMRRGRLDHSCMEDLLGWGRGVGSEACILTNVGNQE